MVTVDERRSGFKQPHKNESDSQRRINATGKPRSNRSVNSGGGGHRSKARHSSESLQERSGETKAKTEAPVDHVKLAAMLRECAEFCDRNEFDALMYQTLQDFRAYYKHHLPKKKSTSTSTSVVTTTTKSTAASGDEDPNSDRPRRRKKKIITTTTTTTTTHVPAKRGSEDDDEPGQIPMKSKQDQESPAQRSTSSDFTLGRARESAPLDEREGRLSRQTSNTNMSDEFFNSGGDILGLNNNNSNNKNSNNNNNSNNSATRGRADSSSGASATFSPPAASPKTKKVKDMLGKIKIPKIHMAMPHINSHTFSSTSTSKKNAARAKSDIDDLNGVGTSGSNESDIHSNQDEGHFGADGFGLGWGEEHFTKGTAANIRGSPENSERQDSAAAALGGEQQHPSLAAEPPTADTGDDAPPALHRQSSGVGSTLGGEVGGGASVASASASASASGTTASASDSERRGMSGSGPLPGSRPAFQRPVNKSSSLIANGWIEQQRRSKMRVVWKYVLASLVEARKPGEETTLWIQREIINTVSGKKELEALHQIPVKWLEEVVLHEFSADNRFSLKVFNIQEEFMFKCNSDIAAMNWVMTLRSAQDATSMSQNPPNSNGSSSPHSAQQTPVHGDRNGGAHVSQPGASASPVDILSHDFSQQSLGADGQPKRYTIRELRATCHGAGINTVGMERAELEAAAERVRARGTYFERPPAPTPATSFQTTTSGLGTASGSTGTVGSAASYPAAGASVGSNDANSVGPDEPASVSSAPAATASNSAKESVRQLRSICHGAGINTVGMERSELEAAAEEVRKRGTFFERPKANGQQEADEEARRRLEEEVRKRLEEEARKAAEEERRQAEEEAARRRAAEEAASRRAAEEEARRRAAEEEARRKAAEEETRRRAAEEEARLRLQQQQQQQAEERIRRQQQEAEERIRLQQAEAERVRQQQHWQQQQQWQRQQQQQEEEQRKRAAEQHAAEQRRRQEAYRAQQQWNPQQQQPQHPHRAATPPQQHWHQQHQQHQQQQHPQHPGWQQQQYAQQQQWNQHHHQQQQARGPPPPQQHHHQQQQHQQQNEQQRRQSAASQKYAKMAGQADDSQAATTRIKHDILIQWALQPPTLQMLRPIHVLITTIHNVFPPALGVPSHEYFSKWKPIAQGEVLNDTNRPDEAKLKKAVRKIRFFLHPDKLPRDLNDEQSFAVKMLWDITSDAWEEFTKQKEELGWMNG